MVNILDDLETARKNRERITEMREREARGEKPLPEPIYTEAAPLSVSLQHGNPHSGALHQGKRHKSAKPSSTPLEDKEPGCTREEFFTILNKVAKPLKPDFSPKQGTTLPPSMQLGKGLQLLRDDQTDAFAAAYGEMMRKYGVEEEEDFDSYLEVLIERNNLSNISKMLKHWIKYLEALNYSQARQGAILALRTLDELCLEVKEWEPKED